MEFDPPPQPPLPPIRNRLVATAAALSGLVLIVATNNQSVTDFVVRKTEHSKSFGADLALATQAFRWRFNTDTGNALAAGYVRDFLTLVLTGVLVATTIRGATSAARVFWPTWISVIAAAQVGAAIGVFFVPDRLLPNAHGAGARLFSGNEFTVNAFVFVGALMLGLLVAIAATVLYVTSRNADARVAAADEQARYEKLYAGWPTPIAATEPAPAEPAKPASEQPVAEPGSAAAASAVPRWGEDDSPVVPWSDDTAALPRWGDDDAQGIRIDEDHDDDEDEDR